MMHLVFSSLLTLAQAKDCQMNSGRYGDKIQFQDMCRLIMVVSDRKDDTTYRSITLNDEGMIQVFSNFPGKTNSDSTGARVYYLFPKRVEKNINSYDDSQLTLIHSSGVKFDFDKNGRVSSPDLKMTVSKEINSKNKSGIEIQSYSKGIVIDVGYRAGNTPILNENAPVTITDKNQKKCSLINSEINKKVTKYDVEFIYKTNADLHKFLSKRCPGLDLSDLIAPQADSIRELNKASKLGAAPAKAVDVNANDSQRAPKKQVDELGDLIQKLDQSNTKSK